MSDKKIVDFFKYKVGAAQSVPRESDDALRNRTMTGASDPKHFCNLSRLGLWGPGTAFRDHYDFVDEMHKGGIGAMELVGFQSKR